MVQIEHGKRGFRGSVKCLQNAPGSASLRLGTRGSEVSSAGSVITRRLIAEGKLANKECRPQTVVVLVIMKHYIYILYTHIVHIYI